jgi:Skp family chaperone for outer membrane proteins
MKTRTHSAHLLNMILIALLTAVVTYQAVGHRAGAVPTTVATVSLMRVMEGLTQRGEAEIELRRMRDEIEAEAERRQGELEQMRDTLLEQPAVPDLEPRREALERGLIELQYWLELKREQVDVEMSIQYQQLYRSIKESVAEMADANGYDLVVVDDAEGELVVNPDARMSREAQIRQQIIARRLLYTSETVDVTNDLIQRMNNRYAAGGGG